jgi:hypothetical protein
VNSLKLGQTTVEYQGDAQGLWIAMREARKHVRSFIKWGELRTERNALAREAALLRHKVWMLETQNTALNKRVKALLCQMYLPKRGI